ncbi:RANBP2-like and GRIP domain-containing protein 2 isoform 1, partial [Daubentonia madagascariensis]
SPRNSVRKND